MGVIERLKKNKIFRLLSSVRLAVPLLIALAATVSVGTVLESKYNADYAKLVIYQAPWFEGLLVLLWINIFCSTISRIPYRFHHLGFVVTHVGLLTLLIGAFITSRYGLDGQLTIQEGTGSRLVTLPDLRFQAFDLDSGASRGFRLSRSASMESETFFSQVNKDLSPWVTVKQYMPFADWLEELREVSDDRAGYGIVFQVKNRFATQDQWLHTLEQPWVQMGPVKLALTQSSKGRGTQLAKANRAKLLILSASTGEMISEVALDDVKKTPVKIGSTRISITKVLEQAIVIKNKVAEGGQKNKNPAIELEVQDKGQAVREVAFALFPEFSLNPKGISGLKFRYSMAPRELEKEDRRGNVIEFLFNPQDTNGVGVRLSKNQETLSEKFVKVGDIMQTPWMDMTIMLKHVFAHSERVGSVRPAELVVKSPLPPSALYIQPSETGSGFWLLENSSQEFSSRNQNLRVRYSNDTVQLPFSVHLVKFNKSNYPGSTTPMSFESEVRLNDSATTEIISMNEPIKIEGYTLYQSSYIENPGEPPVSIFSVNRDPGRSVKYVGSLILALGIIIFTVTRSNWYRQRKAT